MSGWSGRTKGRIAGGAALGAAALAGSAWAGGGHSGDCASGAPPRAACDHHPRAGHHDPRVDAVAVLRDTEGRRVGTVTVRLGRTSTVTAWARRTTPGFHGWHFHAKGVCDPTTVDPAGAPSPFLTAGEHLNPANAPHGDHAADTPPLLVTADGTAYLSFRTDRLSRRHLLDADGSAVILHAGSDNLRNIPPRYASPGNPPGPDPATLATGDAGARFGCGVVRRVPAR